MLKLYSDNTLCKLQWELHRKWSTSNQFKYYGKWCISTTDIRTHITKKQVFTSCTTIVNRYHMTHRHPILWQHGWYTADIRHGWNLRLIRDNVIRRNGLCIRRLTHGSWGVTGYTQGGQLYNSWEAKAQGCYKLTTEGIPGDTSGAMG